MDSKDQYKLSLTISLTDLQSLPTQDSIFVVTSMLMQMIIGYGKKNEGLSYSDQKTFYNIRYKFDEANKTKDPLVILSKEEFIFIDKCRRLGKTLPTANEAVIRIGDLLDIAIREYEDINKGEIGGYREEKKEKGKQ